MTINGAADPTTPDPLASKAVPRVLMVVRLFHPWIGGTERQAQTLASGLIGRGIDVRVVTGRWFRGTARRETVDGIPVFRNHTLWHFWGVRGLRRLGGYLYVVTLAWHMWRTRSDYDIVHCHGMNYHSAVAVRVGRRLGKATITKVANSGAASDVEKMRQDRQLQGARFLLPSALGSDRFVALNAAVVDELRAVGVPDARIVAIPNGVVVDDGAEPPDRGPGEPAELVFVGRLHEQKGLITLLAAVAGVEERKPGRLHTTLVGEGPQRAALETEIGRLGLSGVVELLGETDDVGAVLRRADAFVLPSAVEGLSNALLEAMAHGLPVIVTEIPGNVDVVRAGENGLRFPVGDADTLADHIDCLLEDESLRCRLGRAARAEIEDRYTLDRVVDRYIALYRELMSEDSSE